MKPGSALPSRWLAFALILVLPAIGRGEPPRSEKPKPGASSAAEMVDAIVNRNKGPRLVKWPGDFPSKAALFPRDYDWKEEKRVRLAIGQLEKDGSDEVWEELVKRTNDRRYCETVTSVKTGDAYLNNVGAVCGEIAYSRLIGVFWQHLPPDPGKEGTNLVLDLGIGDLAKWRKQRAGKSLSELQIEGCEKAIKALAKREDVPQAQKDRARKKIEAEIEKLKKTRRPAHVRGGHSFEERGKYDADLAKRVRQGVERGKYGDLGIIK